MAEGKNTWYMGCNDNADKLPYNHANPIKELIFYECVSGQDEIATKQEIYSSFGELLISNDTRDYADKGDHFWNLAIRTDGGYDSADLVIKNTLIIEDDKMRRALVEAVIENDNLHLIKDGEEDNEVVIRYGEYIQE